MAYVSDNTPPREPAMWIRTAVAAATAVIALAAYPNPGRVTGNTGVHDPSVVRSPGGTYIVASTGANIALKTSTDRTAWRNAGLAVPNGARWTAGPPPAHQPRQRPVGAGPLLPHGPLLHVPRGAPFRPPPLGDLPRHQPH